MAGLEEVEGAIETLFGVPPQVSSEGRLVEVPVLYGGAHGPDIEFVARHNGLSVDDVVDIHSKPTYRVYFLGFLPGFAYLGGMDGRIAAPRLERPRLRVPAGSVGIAGNQTGIYPSRAPAGGGS